MDFAAHWNRVLSSGGKSATDIITSITQDSLNHYLAQHHRYDSARYDFEIERSFGTQPVRNFKFRLKALTPLVIDLPAFEPPQPPFRDLYSQTSGWIDVSETDPVRAIPATTPYLRAIAGNSVATVRVSCRELQFTLSWDKFNASGRWDWTPPPIAVAAEANLELIQKDGHWYIKVMPTRIKFDKAAPPMLKDFTEKVYESLKPAEKRALQMDDEKFYDLLLIGLNIVASDYAPKMVQNIEIPVTTINEKVVQPSFFDASENTLTLGASLDTQRLAEETGKTLEKEFARLTVYLEEDIAAKGGLKALVLTEESRNTRNADELKFRSRREIEKDLVRTNAYLRDIKAMAAPKPSRSSKKKATVRAAVSEGLAAGVNEYFFETLINGQLPDPKASCSDWETVLQAVRGRVCSWSSINGFDLAINGTVLTGSINIRVGGAIEGCVRKFWDCSWKWECSKIALGVKGTPKISLSLENDNDGIVFRGRIQGGLELDTNLPFPFKEILNFFYTIIESIIVAFVNLVLSFIRFRIIVPEIVIPDQRTKLKLSRFVPFPFTRTQPAALPLERLKFIGYKANVDAGT